MKDKVKVVALQKEVEYLDYFVDFAGINPKNNRIEQMYVYKEVEFEKQVAAVSLISACRVDMMFKNVGREEKYLLRALTHFSSNL